MQNTEVADKINVKMFNNTTTELKYLLATVMTAVQAEDRQQTAALQAEYLKKEKPQWLSLD